MKSWTKALVALGMIIVMIGGYYGYTISEDKTKEAGSLETTGSAKAVASETVAEFTWDKETSKYENVGVFIADFHEEYNDTLGWGRVDSVKWDEQQDIATEILNIMQNIMTENQALQKDLDSISSYAKAVQAGDKEKNNLLKLHRYFHDLDVEFNGYGDTKDYYNITAYKSES